MTKDNSKKSSAAVDDLGPLLGSRPAPDSKFPEIEKPVKSRPKED